MKSVFLLGIGTFAVLLSLIPFLPSYAADSEASTTVFPIDGTIALEKTVLSMHISPDNKLPWGFVEGTVSNHVEGYPVIIQMYKDDEAVNFAQTNVNEDGTYEYRFRALDINEDRKINIFSGDYIVKIFKVVYLPSASISA